MAGDIGGWHQTERAGVIPPRGRAWGRRRRRPAAALPLPVGSPHESPRLFSSGDRQGDIHERARQVDLLSDDALREPAGVGGAEADPSERVRLAADVDDLSSRRPQCESNAHTGIDRDMHPHRSNLGDRKIMNAEKK